MKKHFLLFSVFFFFWTIILPNFVIGTSALDFNLALESVSDSERETMLDNMQITLINSGDEPEHLPIVCFDVREDGLIAIGVQNSSKKISAICIYKDGVFQYGYLISKIGSSFKVDWEGDCIKVEHEGFVFTIDPGGQIVQFLKDTTNHVSYPRRKKVVEGETYYLRNDLGNKFFTSLAWMESTYSQFCVTDANGETSVLYDAGDAIQTKIISRIAIFGTVLSSGIISMIVKRKKKIDT